MVNEGPAWDALEEKLTMWREFRAMAIEYYLALGLSPAVCYVLGKTIDERCFFSAGIDDVRRAVGVEPRERLNLLPPEHTEEISELIWMKQRGLIEGARDVVGPWSRRNW
jgi:hypothetical protein